MLQSTFSFHYLPLKDEISWKRLLPERTRLCLDHPAIDKLNLTFAWQPCWWSNPLVDEKIVRKQFKLFSEGFQEMVERVCSEERPIVERGIELSDHLRTGRGPIYEEEMTGHLGCALRAASRGLTTQHHFFWTYRDVSPATMKAEHIGERPPDQWDSGSYKLVLWGYPK